MSKGDASIFKASDDLITSLIKDDVEEVELSLGVVTCWTLSVGSLDVISPRDDDVTTGCDVFIGAVVELFSE